MKPSKVSVIIPAYNAAKTISKTLEGLFNQSYPPYEIIVVDDGSIDQTATLIQSFQNVRYLHQANAGPATARNTGAHAATGDILFFTDSDCIPHQDWLKKALKGFQEVKIGVVCGSYGIANPGNRLARCIHQEICYRHHKFMTDKPKVFGSYNFGVRKIVFDKVGGFSGQYRQASGEDNDLSYRILGAGYEILFSRDALVDHYHPEEIKKYLKEQFRHGFWRAKMYLDHPHMASGDGYTFWKDILEIPIVFLILLAAGLGFLWPQGWVASLILFILLFLMQAWFSFVTSKKILDTFFYTFVLLSRAFARTLGFSTGGVWFFCQMFVKKS